MSFLGDIFPIDPIDIVVEAGEDAVNWTAQAGEDAANWTAQAGEDAVNQTAFLIKAGANATAKGFNDAGAWVGGAAESAWEATSDEAEAIGRGVESAGITIGTGFIVGAKAAAKGLEEGVEFAGEGLVAIGQYITEHVCDLAVGAALSAAFAALSADGEEEEATGAVAFACSMGDSMAIDLAATALAKIVVEPVYVIPGVSDALGHKDDVEDVIAFLVAQACEENKETVVATAGQFLAGVLIYGLTSAICEGEIPGGFQIWKGVQAELTGEIELEYEKMDFGFNHCDVEWGPMQTGVTEAEMVNSALKAKAKGFTFHPDLGYGSLMVGDYPQGCKSPANLSWPLYLLKS